MAEGKYREDEEGLWYWDGKRWILVRKGGDGKDKRKDEDVKPPTPTPPAPTPTERPAPYGYEQLGYATGKLTPINPLAVGGGLARPKRYYNLLFDNFRNGIVSRFNRGQQPANSVLDCKNFLINRKTGSLVQRNGYASYLATPFSLVDGTQISAWNQYWNLGTEVPTSSSVDVVVGTISASTGWMQKPFFQGSTTATNNYVNWSETTSLGTLSSSGTNTVVTSSGSATDNYYRFWVLFNNTRTEYIYISSYVGSTKTFTCNENIPSDWAAGDTILAYRWFHDNIGFAPDAISTPIALQVGNSIIASGGQGSTAAYKPVISQYLNKTFFSGATKAPQYWGTYVSEMEVKSTNGVTIGNSAGYTSTGNGLDQTSNWFLKFVFETDDGQLSKPLAATTPYITPTANQGIQAQITFNFPLLNKRFRYLHAFLGSSEGNTNTTTLPWVKHFYLASYDMLTGGTTGADTGGWAYTESTTVPGTYTRTFQFDVRDWNKKAEDLLTFLGVDSEYTNSIVSFSFAQLNNDRLFVAKHYDYTTATNENDQIRWSGFSGAGVPQICVLPDSDGSSRSTIEQGDPTSITALEKYENLLFISKDQSAYYINPTGLPDTWVLNSISRTIGFDSSGTVVRTPYGIVGVKAGDDIYLWKGGQFESMTNQTWIDNDVGTNAFRKLVTTYKSSWLGWYDASWKSYNLMITEDGSDKKTFYSMCFEIPVSSNFAWTRHRIAHNISSVRVDRNGIVSFAATNIYKWSSTALDDAGTAIDCYIDTGDRLVSERDLTYLMGWYMSISQDSSATRAGTLDSEILIDGTSAKTYSDMTKTATRFETKCNLSGGRTVRFKWNKNASPATWTPSSSTATQLTINEQCFKLDVRRLTGDGAQSL